MKHFSQQSIGVGVAVNMENAIESLLFSTFDSVCFESEILFGLLGFRLVSVIFSFKLRRDY